MFFVVFVRLLLLVLLVLLVILVVLVLFMVLVLFVVPVLFAVLVSLVLLFLCVHLVVLVFLVLYGSRFLLYLSYEKFCRGRNPAGTGQVGAFGNGVSVRRISCSVWFHASM